MPIMDGYSFIKAVKSDEILRPIPVVLFSSLISIENKLKGELVEADARISKTDANLLPRMMDRFIFK